MSTDTAGNRTNWLLFVALGFFWGSSYLFIKIGVDAGVTPFTLVTLRLVVGSILLGTVVLAARESLPRNPRIYAHIAILGFFAIALPFSLITIAEEHVPSALAATLTSPIPIFTIPIAALMLGERMTTAKVIGVIVGLVGVAVLMGFDPTEMGRSDVTPEVVLVGAGVSYGLGGVYARKYVHRLRPMIPAFLEVSFSMVMVGACALVFENPIALIVSVPPAALFAVTWLGIFGSGLAYLVFFRLINHWGPTRTSLVAYTLPVWGIALGYVVLNEPIQQGIVLGTLLVIAGISFVNLPPATFASARTRIRVRLRHSPDDTVVPESVIRPR